ncbi:MAG: hypothetical protein ABR518_01370 [Actinomycetota bacterium]
MAERAGVADTISRAVEDALDAAGELAESAKAYLATEEGRELRRKLAAAIIVGVPLVSELPLVRRSPVGRLLRTAALGAIVIKGAEWLRDWDPGEVGTPGDPSPI